MEQLILHLVGDFVLQSDWMARNKVKRLWPAIVHATVYSVPFFLIGSLPAVSVIFATHLVIDRYRLVRYVVWSKNWLGPGQQPWAESSETGFHRSTPDYMAAWLMIIVDATLHLICNYCALRWL